MLILACSGNSTPAKFYNITINDVVTVKVKAPVVTKDGTLSHYLSY